MAELVIMNNGICVSHNELFYYNVHLIHVAGRINEKLLDDCFSFTNSFFTNESLVILDGVFVGTIQDLILKFAPNKFDLVKRLHASPIEFTPIDFGIIQYHKLQGVLFCGDMLFESDDLSLLSSIIANALTYDDKVGGFTFNTNFGVEENDAMPIFMNPDVRLVDNGVLYKYPVS